MDQQGAPVRRFGGWGRELGALLEFVAICGLTVVQPTFELLGDNARLLIAWHTSTAGALAMAALVVLGPPVASWGIEVVVGLAVPRLRRPVHLLLLGLWTGALVVAVAKRSLDTTAAVVVVIGLAGGVAFVLAWLRFAPVRSWLRVLAGSRRRSSCSCSSPTPRQPRSSSRARRAFATSWSDTPRVVMVVLDEFPLTSVLDGAGRIDAGLYPNLAALAGTASWYRNDTTVAPYTEAAVPAILSGRMPTDPHAVPTAVDHPDNLFTLLGGAYDLNVHESVTRLCPAELCRPARRLAGVHPGFTGMLGDVATIWADFATPAPRSHTFSAGIGGEDFFALRAGSAFVRSLRPASGPRLDFLHVLLPHFPWHYLPSGQDYTSFPALPPGIDDGAWVNPVAAATSRGRHLLQVGAADALVGRIMAKLRAIGAFDDSLVVVTADHGVAFRDHTQFRGVAASTYPSIMWTPLFVKYPGQTVPTVDDRPARSVDVLPTIADVLGIHVPWQSAGRSLRGAGRTEGAVPLFEWSSNEVQPKAGSRYLEFDGGRGFEQVLARRAVPGSGADPLRWYRAGPDGDLVGTSAWSRAALGPAVAHSSVDAPLRYQVVDAHASTAPWATIHGRVTLPVGSRVAFAANGMVAGVYTTQGPERDGRSDFSGMVAPVLHDGHNLVQLFTVTGRGSTRVLRSITIEPS